MTLRIGFDMDGVFADLASAYREVDARLCASSATATTENVSEGFVDDRHLPSPVTSDVTRGNSTSARVESRHRVRPAWSPLRTSVTRDRRSDAIWASIRATPNFWLTLKPIEHGAVRRLHALMLEHRWEVFFITERPATLGETVQRQTQRWLSEQGFDMPSVLSVSEWRCAAACGLSLHFYVDDTAKNCVDLKAESSTRSILIVDDQDGITARNARRLGIGTVCTVSGAFDVFVDASAAKSRPHVLQQFAQLVGWR